MAYWRLFYHFVWTTKNREPLIQAAADPELPEYLARKARSLGCLVHAVATMPEHVHVAVSVPPSVALSTLVGELKGASAHYFNHQATPPPRPLVWQNGYGVLSFGEKQLPWVVDYVRRQREHHAIRSTRAPLEECQEPDNGPSAP